MELGQRLSQLRRQQGFSQEQLAEQLGVSRQAVSKWESGSTTPELEKLIALCGLYQVTLDQLLGLEQTPAAPGMSLEAVEALLQEQQRTQKEQEQKQRRRARITWAAIPAAVVLLALCLGIPLAMLGQQVTTLQQKLSWMEGDMNNLQAGIDQQLGSITQEIQSALEEQTSILTHQQVLVEQEDPLSGTLTLSLQAVPKEWTTGMQAEFVVTGSDFSIRSFPADGGKDGFSAQVQVPMDREITVAVSLLQEESTQQQLLDTLYGFGPAAQYRLRATAYHVGRMYIRENGIEYDGAVHLEIQPVTSHTDGRLLADFAKASLSIYRNDALQDTLPLSLTPYRESEDVPAVPLYSDNVAVPVEMQEVYATPFSRLIPCEPGDRIRLEVQLTDTLGRTETVVMDHFVVDEDGTIGESLLKKEHSSL